MTSSGAGSAPSPDRAAPVAPAHVLQACRSSGGPQRRQQAEEKPRQEGKAGVKSRTCRRWRYRAGAAHSAPSTRIQPAPDDRQSRARRRRARAAGSRSAAAGRCGADWRRARRGRRFRSVAPARARAAGSRHWRRRSAARMRPRRSGPTASGARSPTTCSRSGTMLKVKAAVGRIEIWILATQSGGNGVHLRLRLRDRRRQASACR